MRAAWMGSECGARQRVLGLREVVGADLEDHHRRAQALRPLAVLQAPHQVARSVPWRSRAAIRVRVFLWWGSR